MPVATQSQFAQSFLRPKSDTRAEDSILDKRRWTSFLTWAFVLAEMAGRDAFLPNTAHAADADTQGAGHHGGATAPIANNLPNIAVSTATESPEPITYQHAAPMPAYSAEATPGELSAGKDIPAADLGPDLQTGLHGGGGGGGTVSADADTGAEAGAHGVDAMLDQPIALAIGSDGALADLGLRLDVGDTLHSILGGASETLGGFPLIGDTLEGIGNALATTTGSLISALQPLVSLVGDAGSDAHGFGSNLGLPGQLLFSSGGGATASSELVSSHGNYTNYGIALSIDAPHDGGLSGDDTGPDYASGAGAFDAHFVDDLPGSGHAGSDALHLDQSILKTAADILA